MLGIVIEARAVRAGGQIRVGETAKRAQKCLTARGQTTGRNLVEDTAIVEAGQGAKPVLRVVGADTFTPLAGAALLVLPGEADIVAMAGKLA